jgi:hypothetical protein
MGQIEEILPQRARRTRRKYWYGGMPGMATKDEMIQEIDKAFKDTPYPGDDRIVTAYRDYEDESLSDFVGKDWRDTGIDLLCPASCPNKHSSSLCFMTPEAFVYYLPAYMTVSVSHYEELDLLPNNVIYGLTPSSLGDAIRLKQLQELEDGLTKEGMNFKTFFVECKKRISENNENADIKDKDIDLIENTFAELKKRYSENNNTDNNFYTRVCLLTEEQKRCIKHFMLFMKNTYGDDLEDDINVALEAYWSRIG